MNLKRSFSDFLLFVSTLIVLTCISCQSSDSLDRSQKNILIFGTDKGGSNAIDPQLREALATYENTYSIDSLQLLEYVKKDTLKHFSAIVLTNPVARNFSILQKSALERYVQGGGGLVMLSPTAENSYYWAFLGKLLDENASDEILQKRVDGGRIVIVPNGAKDAKREVSTEDLSEWVDFAIGDNSYDPSKIQTPLAPEENRFIKRVLDSNVNEPVELAVLPDGRVLFIERDGTIKLYKPDENQTKIIDKFDVHMTGNYEDGMLGLAAHPLFEKNGWIFIYYSPAGNEPKQNLSRFRMLGDSILRDTEKIVLEVPVQRETCCHSAGSIVFGPDGNLYLSTGDNTSSKESDGYTPLDERSGRAPFDAQKSSGNTNDLRGAILRVKVNSDGSYSIPEGNLFPKDKKDARPEIYLMGLRNPFRFAVDPTNGYVYWGDVGPDAGEDSELGPKSYDEFNQARKPGNFGWPYFVGNNIAYPDFDFATGEIGEKFDPERPVNESPNNTGARVLPPAQEALIWYPYDESAEFPQLGIGSRAAMSGPFYYSHLYPENSRVKFPEYFDGKWFIYDWARSWIKVVTLGDDEQLEAIEDFLPGMEFNKPIDIEFGPDGSMYILEYGANYFTDNDDATLSKIEFAGANMLPVPIIEADQTVGAAPLEVRFSAHKSYDYDGDALSFEWYFTEDEVQASGEEATFSFDEAGMYKVRLKAIDAHGETAVQEKEIKVGNDLPVVTINVNRNQSFFFNGDTIAYEVEVRDREDGTTKDGSIPSEDVMVSFDYLPHGKDLGLIEPHAVASVRNLRGRNLIENSDCKSCHALDKSSIGPHYLEIAERYKDDPEAIEYLGKKIIAGGKGNWGESLMAAHPQHTIEETEEMVKYILSLNDKEDAGMATSGNLYLDRHTADEETGAYIFSARYTDKGGEKVGPLSTTSSLILRHPKIQAEDYDEQSGVSKHRPQGGNLGFLSIEENGAYIKFNRIDATDLKTIDLKLRGTATAVIALRSGNASGKEIGKINLTTLDGADDWEIITMDINGTDQKEDLYIVFEGNFEDEKLMLDWLWFKD